MTPKEDMITYYFTVQFSYIGPFGDGSDDDGPEHEPLRTAEKAVLEAIKETTQFVLKHQYSWPDGSLYKYVAIPRAELERVIQNSSFSKDVEDKNTRATAAYEILRSVFPGDTDNGIRLSVVQEVPKTQDPHKFGCKTVEEYFAKP